VGGYGRRGRNAVGRALEQGVAAGLMAACIAVLRLCMYMEVCQY
jgi:hypothetical protein